MPALLNRKYERFAQARACGESLLKCAHTAGFKCKTHGPAFRVSQRPEVATRILELQEEARTIAAARDEMRRQALEKGEVDEITPAYLLLELRENLKMAKLKQNVAAVNKALAMIAELSGLTQKRPPGRPALGTNNSYANRKAKRQLIARQAREQQKEPEPEPSDEQPNDDLQHSADAGSPGEISDVYQLTQQLDGLSGDDLEEGAPSASEGPGDPPAADGDRGAGEAARSADADQGADGAPVLHDAAGAGA